MTTKKSKPASLTSALLARKGEAGPATDTPSHSEPVRMSAPRIGNGNGISTGADPANHQDDGVFRRLSSSGRSERPYVPSPQAEPATHSDRDAQVQTRMMFQPGQHAETEENAPPSASQPGDRNVSAEMASDEEERDAGRRREAARDARLLRFVYGMAALTGILAIILYAGGWFIERQDMVAATPGTGETAQEQLASAPPALSPDSPAPAAEVTATTPVPPSPPAAMPEPIVIPPAPPATRESTASAEQPAPTARPESAPLSDTAAGTASSAAPIEPVASAPLAPSAPSSAGRETQPAGETASATDTPPATPPVTALRPATPDQPSPPPASGPVESRPDVAKPEPSAPVASPPAADAQPAARGGAATGSAATGGTTTPRASDTSVAARTPPSKPAPVTDVSAPGFYVQLSSLRSEDGAHREWQRLQKAFPESFGGRSLLIEQREIADRGTFFRVQTGGFASLTEAQDFCGTMRAQNQACIAIRK